MAAILTSFTGTQRYRVDLSETLKRISRVMCEGLLLLGMFAVVAFSLLIAAGATGFLG